jgi:hypothetical protein
MSRPRTATEILEARGAFAKNPQRRRPPEPKPTNALRKNPPAHLNDGQKQAWRRIVRIAPPGILMNADEIMLELVSCLLAEFMADPVGMTTARIARLERQLGKLGLSPQDRMNLEIPEPERPNPFDEF